MPPPFQFRLKAGFDTLYKNNYKNEDIITEALTQKRIILTRDPGLLKNRSITRGYLIRGTDPHEQAAEEICRFDLYSQAKPFIRCGQQIKS
ncbi:MAG: hypothetical protein KAT52_07005 [Desulfobacterales bacterium]|nr:hypothetical protein [Desulfobacterales bacterium]